MASSVTPSKRPGFSDVLQALNTKWDLRLPISNVEESPSRALKTQHSRIVNRIKFIFYRDDALLQLILDQFDAQASKASSARIPWFRCGTNESLAEQAGAYRLSRYPAPLEPSVDQRATLVYHLALLVDEAFDSISGRPFAPDALPGTNSDDVKINTQPPSISLTHYLCTTNDSHMFASGKRSREELLRARGVHTIGTSNEDQHEPSKGHIPQDSKPRHSSQDAAAQDDASSASLPTPSRPAQIDDSLRNVENQVNYPDLDDEEFITPPESPLTEQVMDTRADPVRVQQSGGKVNNSLKRQRFALDETSPAKISRYSFPTSKDIRVNEWQPASADQLAPEERPTALQKPDHTYSCESFSSRISVNSNLSFASTAQDDTVINTAQTSFMSGANIPSHGRGITPSRRKESLARAKTEGKLEVGIENHSEALQSVALSRSTSDPGASQNTQPERSSCDQLKSYIYGRLSSGNPFAGNDTAISSSFHFRVRWEVLRLALEFSVPEEALFKKLSSLGPDELEDYRKVWACLTDRKPIANISALKSNHDAWRNCAVNYENVKLSAKLHLNTTENGALFSLRLNPLMLGDSNRLERAVGCDRALTLQVPKIQQESLPTYLRSRAAEALQHVGTWFIENLPRICGRQWVPVFPKPPERSRMASGVNTKRNPRYYTFYLVGLDASDPNTVSLFLRPPQAKIYTIFDILNLSIFPTLNSKQPSLKLFARFGLVLSRSTATHEFEQWQVVPTEDAYAHQPLPRKLTLSAAIRHPCHEPVVMNDGCALVSQKAASLIASKLGSLSHLPSVFQGRIGGSKGVWMLDPFDQLTEIPENIHPDSQVPSRDPRVWMEVTKAQSKFKFPLNGDSLPFEVLQYSRSPRKGSLNYQLLSVLLEAGVPSHVFRNLVRSCIVEEAEVQKAAMRDPVKLYAYIQGIYPSASQQKSPEQDITLSGLPSQLSERMKLLLQSGFEPSKNAFLMECCRTMLKRRRNDLLERAAIPVAQSASFYIVADPLNVLNDDECHLCFSEAVAVNSSGLTSFTLSKRDVVISRSPALTPTDARKLRVVFKPELEIYRDVLVLSSRSVSGLSTPRPMADLLSGGDYDGDTALVIWDDSIVSNFTNSIELDRRAWDASYFGITKNKTTVAELLKEPEFGRSFLIHGFIHHLQPPMLGIVTTYYEAYTYWRRNEGCEKPLSQEESLKLSALQGFLVDALKGGLNFTESDWKDYKHREGLPPSLQNPAYRNARTLKTQDSTRPKQLHDRLNTAEGGTWKHPIDDLVLNYTCKIIDEQLTAFENEFGAKAAQGASWFDGDLTRIWNNEMDLANQHDQNFATALKSLRVELDKLCVLWTKQGARDSENDDNFPILVQNLRSKFLDIKPPQDMDSMNLLRVGLDHTGKELSSHGCWTMLKASCLYERTYRPNPKMAWWICGTELCSIKAGLDKNVRRVVSNLHRFLKADKTAIKRLESPDVDIISDDNEFDCEFSEVFDELGFNIGESA